MQCSCKTSTKVNKWCRKQVITSFVLLVLLRPLVVMIRSIDLMTDLHPQTFQWWYSVRLALLLLLQHFCNAFREIFFSFKPKTIISPFFKNCFRTILFRVTNHHLKRCSARRQKACSSANHNAGSWHTKPEFCWVSEARRHESEVTLTDVEPSSWCQVASLCRPVFFSLFNFFFLISCLYNEIWFITICLN